MLARILTGFPLAVIALMAMAYPRIESDFGWLSFVIVASVAVVSLWELQRMIGTPLQSENGLNLDALSCFLFLVVYLFICKTAFFDFFPLWMLLLLFVLLGRQLLHYNPDAAFFERPATLFASTLFIGLGFGSLFQVQALGQFWIDQGWITQIGAFNIAGLLPFIGTWGYDSCAFFAGSMTGTQPLAQAISPKKSWEGTIGGLVGVAAMTVAVLYFLWAPSAEIDPNPAMYGIAVVLGLSMGAASQLGDLAMSGIKRQAHRKDSSSALGVQGGFLDKYDGLLFVLPVTYSILLWATYQQLGAAAGQ